HTHVIHQDVQSPPLVYRLLDGRTARLRAGHVRLDDQTFTAVIADELPSVLRRGFVHIQQRDLRTLACQRDSCRATIAETFAHRPSAGHDCHLAADTVALRDWN